MKLELLYIHTVRILMGQLMDRLQLMAVSRLDLMKTMM